MHKFANPARFLRMAAVILPWSAGLTALLLGAGLYYALLASPADYQQGDTVRIMYIHVPSAWMGLFCYTAIAVCSVWVLPLKSSSWRRAASMLSGLDIVVLPSARIWSAPIT